MSGPVVVEKDDGETRSWRNDRGTVTAASLGRERISGRDIGRTAYERAQPLERLRERRELRYDDSAMDEDALSDEEALVLALLLADGTTLEAVARLLEPEASN